MCTLYDDRCVCVANGFLIAGREEVVDMGDLYLHSGWLQEGVEGCRLS